MPRIAPEAGESPNVRVRRLPDGSDLRWLDSGHRWSDVGHIWKMSARTAGGLDAGVGGKEQSHR